MVQNVMLNLVQHPLKVLKETLKQVQGDKNILFQRSLIVIPKGNSKPGEILLSSPHSVRFVDIPSVSELIAGVVKELYFEPIKNIIKRYP